MMHFYRDHDTTKRRLYEVNYITTAAIVVILQAARGASSAGFLFDLENALFLDTLLSKISVPSWRNIVSWTRVRRIKGRAGRGGGGGARGGAVAIEQVLLDIGFVFR
jgi:hypothetical protein